MMAIKILLLLTLSAHTAYAQKGSFYLRPALGVHTPITKMLTNNYTKARLTNNVLYLNLYYALAAEYELNGKQAIYLQFLNGISGVSMRERSLPCNNGYTGSYRGQYKKASAFNNNRIHIGYRRPVFKPLLLQRGLIQCFVQSGLALDIENNLEGGKFIAVSRNRCGEEYYLDEVIHDRRKLSLAMPLQLSLQWYNKKNKPWLQFALFATLGLTPNVRYDIDYVNLTLNTREKATFLSRGSSYGVSFSYPIAIHRPKSKNR